MVHRFSVNGIEQKLPVPHGQVFNQLLAYIRNYWVTDSSWISSIRINGEEMDALEENALALRPLSEIGDIEVFTAHPREIAHETLQNLLQFSHNLEEYCQQTADQMAEGKGHLEFEQLIEGITTFTDSIKNSKRVLKIGAIPLVDVLEADLLSILVDLTDYYQKNETAYVCEILRDHLPQNIREWREKGLPAIIRSRDS